MRWPKLTGPEVPAPAEVVATVAGRTKPRAREEASPLEEIVEEVMEGEKAAEVAVGGSHDLGPIFRLI